MTNLMAVFNSGPIDLEEFHQHHLVPSCLIQAFPTPTPLLSSLDDNRSVRMPQESCYTALQIVHNFQITVPDSSKQHLHEPFIMQCRTAFLFYQQRFLHYEDGKSTIMTADIIVVILLQVFCSLKNPISSSFCFWTTLYLSTCKLDSTLETTQTCREKTFYKKSQGSTM